MLKDISEALEGLSEDFMEGNAGEDDLNNFIGALSDVARVVADNGELTEMLRNSLRKPSKRRTKRPMGPDQGERRRPKNRNDKDKDGIDDEDDIGEDMDEEEMLKDQTGVPDYGAGFTVASDEYGQDMGKLKT